MMCFRRWIPLIVLPWVLAASVAARAECHDSTDGGEVAGTIFGAVIGGLLGSAIGSGSGNKVAIGAGVLAGGLLGNKLGASLDCQDRQYHEQTAQDAFETQQTGSASTWKNPDSGHQGTVTPIKTYQREDGTYCREFEQSVTIDGRTERSYGTACRQPDASWKIVG